jgi:hypothetical protein
MKDPSKPDSPAGSERRPTSRRRFLEKSLCGAALACTAALPAWMPLGELPHEDVLQQVQGGRKLTKASARYRDRPNGNQQCAGCVHFLPPGDCEIVEGPISPEGWCRNYKRKVAGRGSAGSAPAGSSPRKGSSY